MHKSIPTLLASSLLLGGTLSSKAANFTWNPPVGGSGGSVSWNNGTNWGGSVPADNITDDMAVFSSTTAYNFQPSLDAFTVQSINGLRFGGASTAAVTLGSGTGAVTTAGASTAGSGTITLSDVTGLAVGQMVTGAGIGVGTFITGIDAGTGTVTLSRNTTGNTASGATLTATSSLRLGNGGINLAAGTPNVNNIVTAPLVLGASQEWRNDAARSLQIQGAIYLDNYTLTLTGTTGSTISFNGSSASQSIGGSGNIIVNTDGTVNFGSGNGNTPSHTFTGGVTLEKGTLQLTGGNSGGTGAAGNLGLGNLTINGGRLIGGGNIAGRPLAISGQVWNADWEYGGGRSINMGTGQISLGNAGGTSRTLTTNGGSYVLTLGGAIVNGTTATSFIKTGSSALLLTGTSTYTGATLVSAGTLIVDGALDGGGDVTVAAGAILSGSGSIAGDTYISGVHRPGNSPGVQTLESNLSYNGGASFEFELAANSSTQGSPIAIFDQVVVGGDLDFAGNTSFSMTFNVAGSLVDWSDAFWSSNQSWLVYDVSGLTSNLGNLSLIAANWADAQGDLFDAVLAGASFSLTQVGNDVYLSYTAVPEPSAVLLLAGGLIATTIFRRRRI